MYTDHRRRFAFGRLRELLVRSPYFATKTERSNKEQGKITRTFKSTIPRATHSGGRPFSSLIQLRDRRHCVVPVDVRKTSVGTFRLVASFYGREKNKGTRENFLGIETIKEKNKRKGKRDTKKEGKNDSDFQECVACAMLVRSGTQPPLANIRDGPRLKIDNRARCYSRRNVLAGKDPADCSVIAV